MIKEVFCDQILIFLSPGLTEKFRGEYGWLFHPVLYSSGILSYSSSLLFSKSTDIHY